VANKTPAVSVAVRGLSQSLSLLVVSQVDERQLQPENRRSEPVESDSKTEGNALPALAGHFLITSFS